MLQNRVDPYGNIIKTEARGAWMGNRGALHNDRQEIIRPFRVNAWLTCRLEFKGRKRQVMAPGKYTELFFLDEATAFSAGHRPCSECRREDFKKFKSLWIQANSAYGFNEKTSIGEIDEVLQLERIHSNESKPVFEENSRNIPDGAFVLINDRPYLICDASAFLWSPFGYAECIAIPHDRKLTVLTPRSFVNIFRAGYIPQIDSSVDAVK